MPSATGMRTFLRAIRTGKTRTTKALEELVRARNPALINRLRASPRALNGLPAWLRAALVNQGAANPALDLSDEEFNHIRHWPNSEKRKVRNWIDTAIGPPARNVHIRWKLHAGNASDNDVDNLPGPGDITITFRSPESRVRARGGPRPDDVTITVP